jgi:hypothetical protein
MEPRNGQRVPRNIFEVIHVELVGKAAPFQLIQDGQCHRVLRASAATARRRVRPGKRLRHVETSAYLAVDCETVDRGHVQDIPRVGESIWAWQVDAATMKYVQHWWTCGPQLVRVALVVASVASVVLGGSADHYWM